MLTALILIVLGIIVLVWSAQRFVNGASSLARWLGLSPLLVGLIIVGLGTSAPEILVSLNAALTNNPGIAIGNALGSNIANIGLIIGISALICPMLIRSETLHRELPLLLLVTTVGAMPFLDGQLTRLEGIMLILSLLILLALMVKLELKAKARDPLIEEFSNLTDPPEKPTRAVIDTLLGLILLLVSSNALVQGATTFAQLLGVSDMIIGLTVIAIGTSLPELAASVTAVLKKEGDLALGNAIGSNMYNLLGVVGVAASVAPIQLSSETLSRDYPVMLGLTVLLFVIAYNMGLSFFRQRQGQITRVYGGLLLLIFIGYQTHLILTTLT